MGCGGCTCGSISNILKRLLVHIAGLNLGLLLRREICVGTPRGLQDRVVAGVCTLIGWFVGLWSVLERLLIRFPTQFGADSRAIGPPAPSAIHLNTEDFLPRAVIDQPQAELA